MSGSSPPSSVLGTEAIVGAGEDDRRADEHHRVERLAVGEGADQRDQRQADESIPHHQLASATFTARVMQ